MLVWLDLETTGLNQFTDEILEVGAIVTDDKLNEVARYSATLTYGYAETIVKQMSFFDAMGFDNREEQVEALAERTQVSAYVIDMHWKNGLWVDCAKSTNQRYSVDTELAEFIQRYAVETDPGMYDPPRMILPPLAGSTISFDRSMLVGGDGFRPAMPKTLKTLNHRNVDVSTLNELAKRKWPMLHDARPSNKDKAHRGMVDIEESIRVCKHYLDHLVIGIGLPS